jgi:hypothetical protein
MRKSSPGAPQTKGSVTPNFPPNFGDELGKKKENQIIKDKRVGRREKSTKRVPIFPNTFELYPKGRRKGDKVGKRRNRKIQKERKGSN